jgi:16S rRNA (guanine527-N7)-methyltransferase
MLSPAMATLSEARIATLLTPYLTNIPFPGTLYPQLSTYLDLLLKWNARTNLTAIRDPEEIVQRHFGESLFTGIHLQPRLFPPDTPAPISLTSATSPTTPAQSSAPPTHSSQLTETPPTPLNRPSKQSSLLDFGSGAGFPGLPIQLLFPHLAVTLAESQNKKSTFLREVVRTLNLPTEIWSNRVETLPTTRLFDIITLRAVDNMAAALAAATPRLASGGFLAILGTERLPNSTTIPLPSPSHGYLTLTRP